MLFYTKTSVSHGAQRDPASCFILSQVAEVIWYIGRYSFLCRYGLSSRDTLALKVGMDLNIRRRRSQETLIKKSIRVVSAFIAIIPTHHVVKCRRTLFELNS